MLTLIQPSLYSYSSVNDLPTPPPSTRPPSSLSHCDARRQSTSTGSVDHSPRSLVMSASHRGLPPPAAMSLSQQQQQQQQQQPPPPPPPAPISHSQLPPPSQQQQQQQGGPAHSPHGHHSHHSQSSQGQPWATLPPPPPQQWQGSEESMRNWLVARAEEERTRQEEEKTRQETLRLEQRRVEMDMLRASLSGGIPPSMVPLVFSGVAAGANMPQAAVEWVQQLAASSQGHHPQLSAPPPPPTHSPDQPQRESQTQPTSQYSTSAANLPPGNYGPYPGSPTRSRGQTVSGPVGRPYAPAGSAQPSGIHPPHPGQPGGGVVMSYSPQSQMQAPPAPQDSVSGIYFHHWQPPATQTGSSSGGSNRPGSPSGDLGKKRKATGPLQQPPGDQRVRSPPPFIQTDLSNPPPGRRGGHKRQKSDMTWYRHPGHHEEAERAPVRASTPTRESNPEYSRERYGTDSGRQSVGALLSHDPPPPPRRSSPERPRSMYQQPHDNDRPGGRYRDDEGLPRERQPSPRKSEPV